MSPQHEKRSKKKKVVVITFNHPPKSIEGQTRILFTLGNVGIANLTPYSLNESNTRSHSLV